MSETLKVVLVVLTMNDQGNHASFERRYPMPSFEACIESVGVAKTATTTQSGEHAQSMMAFCAYEGEGE